MNIEQNYIIIETKTVSIGNVQEGYLNKKLMHSRLFGMITNPPNPIIR